VQRHGINLNPAPDLALQGEVWLTGMKKGRIKNSESFREQWEERAVIAISECPPGKLHAEY
jgi:hypothetical protein